jgi:hypothetical protein
MDKRVDPGLEAREKAITCLKMTLGYLKQVAYHRNCGQDPIDRSIELIDRARCFLTKKNPDSLHGTCPACGLVREE